MATRRWLKIRAGVAVTVTTILGLFGLLNALYGFEIVDIYSKDQVKLDFSPRIKDYALFVPFVPNVTFTPSTDKVCKGKTCSLTIFSGTRNVFEDGEWKRSKYAKSLKDKGFFIEFLSNDSDFPLEVVDFNYTTITLRLEKGPLLDEDIPLRIWTVNYTKESNYVEDASEGKIDTKILKDRYTETYDLDEESFVRFSSNSSDQINVYTFGLGKILQYGSNSTTIILVDNATGNLQDTFVRVDQPTSNFGEATLNLRHNSIPRDRRVYIMFNITSIPDTAIINEALFTASHNTINGGTELALNATTVTNVTWREGSVTWNTQPCGANWDATSQCNFSTLDQQDADISGLQRNYTWNVTDGLRWNFESEKDAYSIAIRFSVEGGSQLALDLVSKEVGTANLRPFLNVTYTAVPEDTCTPPGSGVWDLLCSDNCSYNSLQQVPGNVSIVGSGNLTFFSGGIWNFTNVDSYVFINQSTTMCEVFTYSGGGWNPPS